jgi:hypothetical protein
MHVTILIICHLLLYNLLFLVIFHLYRKLNLQKKTLLTVYYQKPLPKLKKKLITPFANGFC